MTTGPVVVPVPRPPTWKVIAGFGVVYVVWGSTYFAIRIGVETLPPFTLAGVRWLVAGLILFVFPIVRSRPRVTAAQWRAAALVGGLMLLGGNGLVCWAEQWVASGLAALLVGTVPLWLVFLDWICFRGERPGRATLVGLLLGSAGVLILVGPHSLGGQPIHIPGAIALVIACACWALGSLYSRRVDVPSPMWLASATQMIAGGVILLGVALATGEFPRVHVHAVSWRSLAALIYLILAGSIITLTTYLWLLKVSTPARLATYAYVNPLIAILLGCWLLGEPFTPRVALAAAVILTAVVVITQYRRRPRQSAPAAASVLSRT